MPQWTIKSVNNERICTVKSVERHGQLMSGRWLTVDIDSPVSLPLSAGCYIDFGDVRYSIRSQADVEKSARPQSHGGAFTYKDLRLDDVSWQELEDTQMCDYVYGDNRLHYSGLGTFSFYVTKASDLGYRVLANLRNKYGNTWDVKIDGSSIAPADYIDYNTFDEAKSISISSGTNVKECLDLLWSNWGVYYTVENHVVDIITSSNGVSIPLRYGKNNGLKSIRRKINPNVEICTRVRAYGSERNMPYKWYNNKYNSVFGDAMYVPQLMLPHYAYVQDGEFIDANGDLYTSGGTVDLWSNPSDIVLPSKDEILQKYGKRDKEVHWNSDEMGEIFPSMKGMTATEVGVDSDTWADDRLDLLLSTAVNEDGTPITGTGETSELTTGKINFKVQVPNPGFDPMAQKGQEDVVLLMQSGMCQSRGFVILKSEAVIENEQVVAYDLTCVKSVDDEIDQVFPNGNYTINGGEEYVYTGLSFSGNDLSNSWLAVYIGAAEKRLLRAAALWLREHQTEQYVYEITPDNVYLQRKKDEAEESNEVFEITEGDKISLSQDDLGESDEVVETVTVVYGKEAIPTYEITFLKRDESESLGDRVKGLVGQTISVDSDIAKMNDSLYKKVNRSGFHTLFDPLDAQYNVLDINGDLSNLKYIRANVDFYSVKGVSALGTGGPGGGGGGGDLNALLDSINSSSIGDIAPTASETGKCLVYNGNGNWAWTTPGGGGGGSSINTVSVSSPGLLTGGSVSGTTLTLNTRSIQASDVPFCVSFQNQTSYVAARLYNSDNLPSLAHSTYIEWWSSAGWYNHAMGHLILTDGSNQIWADTSGNKKFSLPSTSGTLATQEWVSANDANNYLTDVSGSANGTMTFTRQGLTSITFNSAHTHSNYVSAVSFNNSATLTSPYYVVTTGSVSGNTLTLGRRKLSDLMNAAQYSWWGRTMNTSGVVDGGLQSVEYIEFSKTSGQSHGGHLDFHYAGNTTADYTSRIIEDANGRLSINSAYFNSNGNVGFGTTPHGTAKVNVSGAIRFDGNFLTKSGSYPEIASVGNELVVTYQAASQGGIHINYRGSSMSGYVAPNEWIIHAGTSSSYAALTIGNLTAKGSAIVGMSTSDTSNYIQIGGGRIYWDNTNNALYVQKANGEACHFYSLGGVSALGVGVSGTASLNTLTLASLTVNGTATINNLVVTDAIGTIDINELNIGNQLLLNGNNIYMDGGDIQDAYNIQTSELKVGSGGSTIKKIYWNGTYLQVQIGSSTYNFRPV